MSNNPEQFTQELSSDQIRYLQEQPAEVQVAFYRKNNQSQQFDPIKAFQALSNEAKTILWSTTPTESPHRTTIQQATILPVTEAQPVPEKNEGANKKTVRNEGGKKLLLAVPGVIAVGALGWLLSNRPTTSQKLEPTKKPSSSPVVPTSTNVPHTLTPTPTITFTPENKVIVQVPTETGTPTPTPTATRDLEATIEALNKLLAEAQATKPPTVVSTATLIPASPTAVPVPIQMTEDPEQKTVTPNFGKKEAISEISSAHLPIALIEKFVTVGGDGIAHLSMDEFRTYFAQSLKNKGEAQDGNVDYLAQMLAAPVGRNGMTLSHAPNFWMNSEVGGLGWRGDEPIYAGLEAAAKADWQNWFGNITNRTEGFAVLVKARDFDETIEKAVVARFIEGAGLQDRSATAVKKFLESNDAKIKATVDTLIESTGYEARGVDKTVKPWPGASAIYASLLEGSDLDNYIGDEGRVCLKVMVKAGSREDQIESTDFTTYTVELEKSSSNNDETMNRNDSDSEVLVFFTFDKDAKATSGGAYSPNDKGTIRVDIARVADQPDAIAKREAADGNIWIPCGVGRRDESKPSAKKTDKPSFEQETSKTPEQKITVTAVLPNSSESAATATPGQGVQTLVPATPAQEVTQQAATSVPVGASPTPVR